MLTERHLAAIRAALKFWDEEMSPHGDEMFVSYLEEPDRRLGVAVSDVGSARELMGNTRLAYALVDTETNALLSDELISPSDDSEMADHTDRARIVSVLVPKPVND